MELWGFLHTRLGSPNTEKEQDCFNETSIPKAYRQGLKDEFYMEELREDAKNEMNKYRALAPQVGKTLYKWEWDDLRWSFGKYDSATESFPVESYGYISTDPSGFGLTAPYNRSGRSYNRNKHCLLHGIDIAFDQDKSVIDKKVAFKIPRDKAKAFLRGRPEPRALYVCLLYTSPSPRDRG